VKIRLIGRWLPQPFRADGMLLSSDLLPEEADALLCVYQPLPELLAFRGPRAWYCCEPYETPTMGACHRAAWQPLLRRLPAEDRLYHGHPLTANRIPQVTHWEPLSMRTGTPRRPRAVAVASNHGGLPWLRWPEIRLRNHFCCHPRADLYGDPARWRWSRFPWPGRPRNFRGPIPGGWGGEAKLALMATYHAAVCLENSYEPHYFTEKFVDAVRAGCVPVYRAHPTVRDGVLRGARWVDPADFGLDPGATLAHALSVPPAEIQAANREWLRSEALKATHGVEVYASIARFLRARSERGADRAP
jgi:hypothetical protein